MLTDVRDAGNRTQIPWRSLGQSPVIVELDSIFLLACPKTEEDELAAEAEDVRCVLLH